MVMNTRGREPFQFSVHCNQMVLLCWFSLAKPWPPTNSFMLANRFNFLTWDQYVPWELNPRPSPQHCRHPYTVASFAIMSLQPLSMSIEHVQWACSLSMSNEHVHWACPWNTDLTVDTIPRHVAFWKVNWWNGGSFHKHLVKSKNTSNVKCWVRHNRLSTCNHSQWSYLQSGIHEWKQQQPKMSVYWK